MKPTDKITPEGKEALYEIADELKYLVGEIERTGMTGRSVGELGRVSRELSEQSARLSRLVDCDGKSVVYPPTALPA